MNHSSQSAWKPEAGELHDVFSEEIASAGGRVLDAYLGNGNLITRATLPLLEGDAKPKDRIQGGVAIRTRGREVLVHPYTFRLVCKNGAVHPLASGTRGVLRVEARSPEHRAIQVLDEVREAIRLSSQPEVFRGELNSIRSALDMEADHILRILPLLARVRKLSRITPSSFQQIEIRYHGQRDRSLFGLMNAVTSTARDTRDPDTRWNLEELGGAIGARRILPRPIGSAKLRPFPDPLPGSSGDSRSSSSPACSLRQPELATVDLSK